MAFQRSLIDDLLALRQAAAASEDGQRCMVAPHPELRESIRTELARLKESAAEGVSGLLRAKSLSRPGFNDGLIYPGSMFPIGTSAERVRGAAGARAPLSGQVRVIVVLVDFPDQAMAQPRQHFEDLFFSNGVLPHGSCREYYADVSNNVIDLRGEVVGPYRLANNLAYYANGDSGVGAASPNARTMAKDAVLAADADVNFGNYDNDGDGFVDAYVVIHAGQGAEATGSTGDIWSHKWVLEGGAYSTDGTKIYAYLTVPEDARIGVCCHELGHLLFGFPDLYDTDYSSEGVGDWCLMGGGSWNGGGDNPAHPCAWCKANQGWATVQNVTNNAPISIPDVKTSHTVHRLWKDGASGSEYFLVENRQRDGYDADLPGDGLLIWHIDEAISSNSNENHYKVALMQADGLKNLEHGDNRGDAGDPFPGTSNNTDFGDSTTPNSRSYGDVSTCVSLRNISASGATMTADATVKCISKSLLKDFKDSRPDKPIKDYLKDQLKEHLKDGLKEYRKELYKEKREKELYEKDISGEKKAEKPAIDKASGYDKGFTDGKPYDFDWPGGDFINPQQGYGPTAVPFIGEELRPDLTQGALSGEEDAQLLQSASHDKIARAKRSFDTKLRDA